MPDNNDEEMPRRDSMGYPITDPGCPTCCGAGVVPGEPPSSANPHGEPPEQCPECWKAMIADERLKALEELGRWRQFAGGYVVVDGSDADTRAALRKLLAGHPAPSDYSEGGGNPYWDNDLPEPEPGR